MEPSPQPTPRTRPFETWAEFQEHLLSQGLKAGDPSVQGLEEARALHESYLLALGAQERLDGHETCVTFQANHASHGVMLVEPPGRGSSSCGILYLRGAGWWAGSLQSSRPVVHRLARETRMPVCAVDYRRIPEHPFPAQIDDVLAALDWLGSRSGGGAMGLPRRWILWGESAGASLAVCTAGRTRELHHLPPIDGMVLLYGNHAGPHLHSARSRWIWERYLASLSTDQHAMAIPVLQPPARLPPTFVAVGQDDPLLHDSRRLHHHLVMSGVSSTLREFPGLAHSFAAMASMLAPAQAAFSACAAAARSIAAQAQAPRIA